MSDSTTNTSPSKQDTIDISPSVPGVARWARNILSSAAPDSNDAAVARRILAEIGETP